MVVWPGVGHGSNMRPYFTYIVGDKGKALLADESMKLPVSRKIIAEIWVAFSQNLSDNLADRVQYFGCPSPWVGRGVRYDDDDSSAILRGVRSQFGKKDTDLLM